MDLETENRIAAMLMREAAELRRQAQKEGIHAYLQPKVRGRPNSRFLTATVRGVQQANRAVEVSEMWRAREKELELDNKLQGRSSDESSRKHHSDHIPSTRSTRHRETDRNDAALCTSSKRTIEESNSNEDGSGLRDEEVEDFLHSRVKRGRGAIGSRMDETGPYLPPLHSEDSKEMLASSHNIRVKEDWEHRVLGPEKPSSLKKSSWKSSSDNNFDQEGTWKKVKKVESGSSSKKHSKKHKLKDKSRDKKKAKISKESKHRHRSRSRSRSRSKQEKKKV